MKSQQARIADELYNYLKTILEAPLLGYVRPLLSRRVVERFADLLSLFRTQQKFLVLGFTHPEIRCAVQAAIAKLGGRYLLEKELETTATTGGEGELKEKSIDVDFVLVSK